MVNSFPVSTAFLLVILFGIFGCKKKSRNADPEVTFAGTPISVQLTPGMIDEASGIADSKINPGYLWVEQDGGNPNSISLLSYSGTILKQISVKPAINRDWEDISIANGPTAGSGYLYLADIGDNNSVQSVYTIYRFQEPNASIDTVTTVEAIRFQYPDGSHDAEAILVDNFSRDIYIITKRDAFSRIYKLPYPQNTVTVNTAIYSGSLPFNGAVSAATSASGDELLVKTYNAIYYWKRLANETIEQTLTHDPITLGYQQEPQGEAICFRNDNKGFYTLSERPTLMPFVNLNYYERK